MGLDRAGCTSFAAGRGATVDGGILSGQNSDQSPLNTDLQIVLSVEPDEGPACLMASFAGLVGYPGLNEAGVSFFQNALSTPTWVASGIPHYLVKRVLLEQTSLEDCLAVFRRVQFCSSANYVVTDRQSIVDVETTPEGFALVTAEGDLVTHGNHFLHPDLVPQEALLPALPDSACREPRLRALLEARRGTLSLADVKAALSDHDRTPASICRHEEALVTIASIVAEPDQGRLHVAVGNPCENEYVAYSL
jgi:isopenicillin-N N-acyltransferase-like protein